MYFRDLDKKNENSFFPPPKMTLAESLTPAIPSSLPTATLRPSQWRALGTFNAHNKPISSIKFSLNGRFLASASADSTIKVWSIDEITQSASKPTETLQMEPTITFQGHTQGISDVSWSSNSTYLVSASDDKTVRIWDLEQKKNISILGTPMLVHNVLGNLSDDFFKSNETTSIVSGTVGDEDRGHSSYVFCCEFNPQGTLIVSGSYDGTVRVWDVRTGKCVYRLIPHREAVSCVDFCYDGTLLATASTDGLVRIWDVASMQCLREIIMTPTVPITQARFTPNAKYLLIANLEHTLFLWDYRTAQQPTLIKTYQGHVNQKYGLAVGFLKDKKEKEGCLLCGSEDGRVFMWNLSTQEIVETWGSATSSTSIASVVLGLSIHPSQTMIATSQNTEVTIWMRS